MNIIFLDFDGVCNKYFDGSFATAKDDSEYNVSRYCTDLIRYICETVNAKIIISSNWRKFDDNGCWHGSHGIFKNPLNKLRAVLGDLIIESLPAIRHHDKSYALNKWFEINNLAKDQINWVVIDDDEREHLDQFGEHFFKTEFADGITKLIADKIIEYFNSTSTK